MKKRNIKSFFSGFAHKSKLAPEEAPVANQVIKVPEEKKEEDDNEDWGEEAPDETETQRKGPGSFYRELPPKNDFDTYSIATSSDPSTASSTAIRKCATFDHSEASLSSRQSNGSYSVNASDAQSIVVSERTPIFLRRKERDPNADDSSVSIADSSFTTRASGALFINPPKFDLSGTNLLGISKDESEPADELLYESSSVGITSAFSYANTGVTHGFSRGVHSFIRSVLNPEITEEAEAEVDGEDL